MEDTLNLHSIESMQILVYGFYIGLGILVVLAVAWGVLEWAWRKFKDGLGGN